MPLTLEDLEVPVEQLRKVCDPEDIRNAGPDRSELGQAEALQWVDQSLEMTYDEYTLRHYNATVVGPESTGRSTRVYLRAVEYASREEFRPPDTVCLYDFESPLTFDLIEVPNGTGKPFRQAIKAFGKMLDGELREKVNAYRRKNFIPVQQAAMAAIDEIRKLVEPAGLLIVEDGQGGVILVRPSRINPEEGMSDTEFEQLSDEEKAALQTAERQAAGLLESLRQKTDDQVDKIENSIAALVEKYCGAMLKKISAPIGPNEAVERYLEGLKEFAVEYVLSEESQPTSPMEMIKLQMSGGSDATKLRKATDVNVVVDSSGVTRRPVEKVEEPQYSELHGWIAYQPSSRGDGLVTVDHTMIKAGAVHRANHGYLIVDFDKMLQIGGGIALFKLLQTIETQRAAIEGKSSFADVETLVNFRTEEMPINVRVIGVCSRHLDSVLRQVLPEFGNLFRITSEFDWSMNANEAPAAYTEFLQSCRHLGDELPQFSAEAIARLVEYGCRRAGRQSEASTELGVLKDIFTEASYWARRAGAEEVGAEHVNRAIKARFDKRALAVRKYQRSMDDGGLILDLEGEKVGQVNGLAVLAAGSDIAFGLPLRITARAFAGKEKLLLVQRETKQSGPSSNQAVAIIRGYLSGQYGREKPLSLAVQLCFEQTSGIEGDSASLAETIAIVSAVTGLPVNQKLAITGSMDQYGNVQPIGGVNEKIEGMFNTLERRGMLTGGHGVVIPHQNVKNLMLDETVVRARNEGKFRIAQVTHVDQALELFLGRPVEEIHALFRQKLDEIKPSAGGEGVEEKKDEPERDCQGCDDCGDRPE